MMHLLTFVWNSPILSFLVLEGLVAIALLWLLSVVEYPTEQSEQ
jgi:hypothetical protein